MKLMHRLVVPSVLALVTFPLLADSRAIPPLKIYVDAAVGGSGAGTAGDPYGTFLDAVNHAKQYPQFNIHLMCRGTFDQELRLVNMPNPSVKVTPWIGPDAVNQFTIRHLASSTTLHSGTFPTALPSSANFAQAIFISASPNVTIDGVELGKFSITGVRRAVVIDDTTTPTVRSNNIVLKNLHIRWIAQTSILARPVFPAWSCSAMGPRGQSNTGLTIRDNIIDQTNLGWIDSAGQVNRRSEAVSISSYENVVFACNRLTNSLQEGVDFKNGTAGRINNNEVAFCRSAATYLNECGATDVYRNVVAYGGYYQEVDANGQITNHVAAEYMKSRFPSSNPNYGGNGISIAAGDLCKNSSTGLNYETGIIQGINVFENEIYHCNASGISVSNNWDNHCRKEELTQCNCQPPLCGAFLYGRVSNILIVNNTIYKVQQMNKGGFGGIAVNGQSAFVQVANNIVVGIVGGPSTAASCIEKTGGFGRYAFNIYPDVAPSPIGILAAYNCYHSNQGFDYQNPNCVSVSEGGPVALNFHLDPRFAAVPPAPIPTSGWSPAPPRLTLDGTVQAIRASGVDYSAVLAVSYGPGAPDIGAHQFGQTPFPVGPGACSE